MNWPNWAGWRCSRMQALSRYSVSEADYARWQSPGWRFARQRRISTR